MPDILEVYHGPYDPRRPAVCMNETLEQLTRAVRQPLPPAPGRVERVSSSDSDLCSARLAWGIRPELAALHHQLQGLSDGAFLLVEDVERLAQLVAASLDLVTDVER